MSSIDLTESLQILSINKALSIQAHPDKALAEELFKQHPQCYKVRFTAVLRCTKSFNAITAGRQSQAGDCMRSYQYGRSMRV